MELVIQRAIECGLKDEAQFLRRFHAARESLKELIEVRDEDYSKIILAISQNAGINIKLRKTYPAIFDDEKLAARIERGILEAFELVEPMSEDLEEVKPVWTVRPRRKG